MIYFSPDMQNSTYYNVFWDYFYCEGYMQRYIET